ncbi:D-sedoheptulose 7-phosphate isomerase [uncultured Bacteroides sp.]|uniref:D-sedoheptulose-7-phosphate isomerase n=1 Tax=uncultured Bacteroides sp. TaxID=162156 RepID=UPI002AA91EDA|nr:D-sedoheptulose 7-phosphate isomerase [uncultured Bacteroides sp.]
MDNKGIINNRISEHLLVMQELQKDGSLLEILSKAATKIIDSFQGGNSVYFCGNGGSAADAQHLAAEFSGKFYIDRPVLPSEALHCNSSYMTAVSNDYSYDIVYARLISGIGRSGDVLVGLSTSGNSRNVIEAFNVCRDKGIYTVALLGNGGGKMAKLADYCLIVPSNNTPRIQEMHIMLGHILCEIVESSIFGGKK